MPDVVQLIKMLWTLPIIILIAPLGLAVDSNHELASSTNTALELIVGGNFEAFEPKGSSTPVQWDYMDSASVISQKRFSNYSRSNMNELFNSINYATLDSESSHENNRINDQMLEVGRNSNNILLHDAYCDDIRIASSDVARGIGSDFRYIHDENRWSEATLARSEDLGRDISSNLQSIYMRKDPLHDDRVASTNLNSDKVETNKYYYENKNYNKYVLMSSVDAAREINLNFNYIYEKSYAPLQEPQREVHTRAETDSKGVELSRIDRDRSDNPYLSALTNIVHIRELAVSGPDNKDASNIKADITVNLNSIVQQDGLNIYKNPFKINAALINTSWNKKISSLIEKNQSCQNYAVVIGIDHYSDYSDLHTCVNDADTVAALLETYGYNVVKLTDKTNDKPTKENILNKALGELKHKKDLGKLLIYFSGHGEKLGDNYYLIPQDGNGLTTSYINAKELERCIHGLKNVALVVDACNSGELGKVIDSGQMILVSSQEDQSSNEIWFGSLSLFTYNLCNAIKDEKKLSGTVILERCFYKAREETERWASWRLVSQTPQMRDNTEGFFSLN